VDDISFSLYVFGFIMGVRGVTPSFIGRKE